MKIIRHKTNHKILCAGFIEAERPEFDPSIFEEIELDILPEGFELYILPLAMGKEIVAEIELAVASKPITERLELVKLFNNLGFKELLLSSSCNPLRAVDVPDLLEMFNNSAELNIEVKGLITNIINSYLTTHKLS
jgi:hypothetical protein